jgi:hypothetical protein
LRTRTDRTKTSDISGACYIEVFTGLAWKFPSKAAEFVYQKFTRISDVLTGRLRAVQ